MRIAVVGAGPGGLSCALRVSERATSAQVQVFELGRKQQARLCPVDLGYKCQGCKGVCNVISGVGGSIHYGDSVKISGYPSGRRLLQLIGESEYWKLQTTALSVFGLDENQLVAGSEDFFHGRALRQYPIAELSELRTARVIDSAIASIKNSGNRIRFRCAVEEVATLVGGGFSLQLREGSSRLIEEFDALVLATGRAGFSTTNGILDALGIGSKRPNISLGIRLEFPSYLLSPLYSAHTDFKFSEVHDGHKIKSFCFSNRANVGGRIKYCHYQNQFRHEVVFLDGHSNVSDDDDDSTRLPTGNFALLAQLSEDLDYNWLNNQFVERYHKLSNGKPVFQELGAFLGMTGLTAIARSPSVGDCEGEEIAQLIPLEVLYSLRSAASAIVDTIASASGVSSRSVVQRGLVLAPEVEFFWPSVDVSETFETSRSFLYVVGDAAGIAQGNLQAAISGVAAGNALSEVT